MNKVLNMHKTLNQINVTNMRCKCGSFASRVNAPQYSHYRGCIPILAAPYTYLISNVAAQISVLNRVDIRNVYMCPYRQICQGPPLIFSCTKIYYECNNHINLEAYKVRQQELEDMQSSKGKRENKLMHKHVY